jgi:hypothetical protein
VKRRATVIALLLMMSAVGSADADTKSAVGFKGGMAFSDFGGSDVTEDVGNRTAFAGGLYVQSDFSRYVGFRVEALYHMKGFSETVSGIRGTFKMDYVELPLLLVGQLPQSENTTLSAFAGPVFAINTKAEIEASQGSNTGVADVKYQMASFEFAMAFGLGVSVDTGSVDIGLDGRYQLGLTTVDGGLFSSDTGKADVENRGWVFMVSVGFPIASK